MKTRTITLAVVLLSTIAGFTSCKNQTLINAKSECSIDLALGEVSQEELLSQIEQNGDITNPNDQIRACEIPEQDPNANLEINVSMTNFNELQEAKMREALKRLKFVMNSVEFRERVLNHTFNGEKTFVENNGMSNEEIYENIMNANETLLPDIDHEMDLDVTLYYKYGSTVGYTYPNTTRIWVNSRFFGGFSFGQVAANAAHEWTHKLGFGHSFYNNSARPYTVPYGIGSIVNELVDNM